MVPNDPKRKSKAEAIAQQEVDFTSEGAPPPGKVSTTVPATGRKPGRPKSRRPPPAGNGSKRAMDKTVE